MSEAHHPVVILYEHPLLGEGIAKYLRAHLGVEATITSASDLEAVTAALLLGPAVVIFELSDRLRQLDLAALAPHADLIDVSTVMARGPVDSSGVAGLERLLQAVRGCITIDEDHGSMGGAGSGVSAEPPDDGARDQDARSGHRGGHREADRQGHAPDQSRKGWEQ